MPRYNTSLASASVSGSTTIGSPYNGAFIELTGTAPYTVTLPNPTLYPGSNQTFYNASSGTITLTTPSGIFTGTGGSGNSNVLCYMGNVVSVTSDGTNYIVISEDGSALVATTGTFSGDVSLSGAGASVSISPNIVTMSPAGGGNINNVNIGVTTRGTGAFTTLAANGQTSLTANITSTNTGSGTLVVTGGIGASGTINASAVSASSITGTLQTAAQPNITSLGTLISVSSSGNVSGNNGRLVLRDDSIENWATDNDTAGVAINYYGYQGGTTRNRNFTVYNGKAAELLKVTGSTGYANFNNRVGIGTSNPSQLLQLVGTVAGNDGLTIQNTNSSGNAQVRFLNSSGAERAAITYVSSDAVYHYTAPGGNLLNLVGDKIGIATTSPLTTLDVRYSNTSSQSPQVNGFTLRTNQGNGMEWHLTHTNGYQGWVAAARVNNVGSSWGQGYLEFITAGTGGSQNAGVLTLTGAGYVGVGTTTPGNKLDVSGQASFTRAKAYGDLGYSSLDWIRIGDTTWYDTAYYAPWILLFQYTDDSHNIYYDIDVSVHADPNYAYASTHNITISRHGGIGTEIRGVAVRHIGGRDNYLQVYCQPKKIFVRSNGLWGDGVYARINQAVGASCTTPFTGIGRDANISGYNSAYTLTGQGMIYNQTGVTDYPSTLSY